MLWNDANIWEVERSLYIFSSPYLYSYDFEVIDENIAIEVVNKMKDYLKKYLDKETVGIKRNWIKVEFHEFA